MTRPAPVLLAAVERRSRASPDLRLGQLLMNLIRWQGVEREHEGEALFALEDGELLRRLGPGTPEELTYVNEEPTERRKLW